MYKKSKWLNSIYNLFKTILFIDPLIKRVSTTWQNLRSLRVEEPTLSEIVPILRHLMRCDDPLTRYNMKWRDNTQS